MSRGRSRRRRMQMPVLFFVFLAGFLISFIWMIRESMISSRESAAFESLASLTVQESQTVSDWQMGDGGEETLPAVLPDTGEPETEGNEERFRALTDQNQEFMAWLTIEGTRINYPVMYSPEDPEYYLNHDFYGEPSEAGVPFIGVDCTPDSNHLIIYGHHKRDGSMFTDLLRFAKKEFWEEHRTLEFDTVEESGEYEILAAFYEKVHYQDETDVFRYYSYGGDLTRERWEEYLDQVSRAALYETGVETEYGDRLLTLSTCAYHTENGRFVVVARKTGK